MADFCHFKYQFNFKQLYFKMHKNKEHAGKFGRTFILSISLFFKLAGSNLVQTLLNHP